MLDPVAAERQYETWIAPGAAADDDDRVVARRERPRSAATAPAGSAPPPVRVPQAARLRLEHPVHDRRVVEEERAGPRLPARTRQRSGRVATMSATGASPSRIETSPKKSPRPSVARSLAVDDDRGLAVEDHVERRSGEALAQDALAFGDRPPPRTCGRPVRAAGVARSAKSAKPGDLVDDLVAGGHGDAPSVAVCAQRTAHRQFCHRRGCRLTSRARRRSIIFVPRWRTR